MVWKRVDVKSRNSSKADFKGDATSIYYYFMNHGDMGIVWPNVAVFVIGHLLGLKAYYIVTQIDSMTNLYTFIWVNSLSLIIGLGVTAGAHRLWAHKSYEASFAVRVILMIGQTLSGQNCIYIWARDHRVHHKWSDTDGDPHNTRRGFFFTHVGWLLRKKHPEMLVKAKSLDFSDLLNDPVVKFQKDYYWALYLIFSCYLPIAIPVYCWGEDWWTSFLGGFVLRYILSLHVTWFVNSAAHMFGDRPYNAHILPGENGWVSVVAYGEGYHNYHHNYPSDYQCSEGGAGLNAAKHVIDFLAKCGLAYNLKTTSKLVVDAAKERNSRSLKMYSSDEQDSARLEFDKSETRLTEKCTKPSRRLGQNY